MERLVIICDVEEELDSQNGEEYLILNGGEKNIAKRYESYAKRMYGKLRQLLLKGVRKKVMIQLVGILKEDGNVYRGLLGMLKTANQENPNLLYQIVEFGEGAKLNYITEKLLEESRKEKIQEVRYQNGIRYVKTYETKAQLEEQQYLPWREKGVYLITGGMGGLGLLFAKEIAKQLSHATIILTGRSTWSDKMQEKIDEICHEDIQAFYYSVDIRDYRQVKSLIDEVIEKHGTIHGILHCAGVTNDNYIINKSEEEFKRVLEPKVDGIYNLDRCTQQIQLDFMVMFSSESGENGNAGQADYATANAFMDAFAEKRMKLVKQGRRFGHTVSVNWPLWEDGGMHVVKEAQELLKSKGMIPLRTQSGLNAFYQVLSMNSHQVMVMEGNAKKIIRNQLNQDDQSLKEEQSLEKMETMNSEELEEKTIHYLKKVLSKVIKLSPSQISAEEPMENYGIDSVMILSMTSELEKQFGKLPKTLFFEYQNIKELSQYFMEEFKDALNQKFAISRDTGTKTVQVKQKLDNLPVRGSSIKSSLRKGKHYKRQSVKEREPVAIIGLAGRYPEADTLEEFWSNLCEGKDSVTEIPKERWDYRLYFDEDRSKKGKTYSKWGGFIHDADKFDPLFFHITPQEAKSIDPQERIFLECVYHTLEDAGYTREALRSCNGNGMEGNVGVFAGVMYSDYQLFGIEEQDRGHMQALNGITSSIANRVSYYCNFHGPSVTLNTMCSSSLYAVHLACQSLYQGECEMAVAGGVNLSIHPNKYLLLSQSNFLSSKGKCESFGKDGDGYVPGEGVGTILLKPLSKAIEDQDHIYGVIKSSAMNHDGKTNGFTVPNPKAQANLIRRALKDGNVNPEEISYVEAHGTGTALGDPIEVQALTKAYADFTEKKQFCSIGSVKSNIGHLESAAGIASITKVLLQMKYKKLVPSIHSQTLNPNIDFERTPFRVQQKLEDWKRPVSENENERAKIPRMAAISAFGAGGTNVHLIIEEYIKKGTDTKEERKGPFLILLSAKEEAALREEASQLLKAVKAGRYREKDLPNIAYTLQTGREMMEERLGFQVNSMNELERILNSYLDGNEESQEYYTGRMCNDGQIFNVFQNDGEIKSAIPKWITNRKYNRLLELWSKGMAIDWNLLYEHNKLEKISLPLYPFRKERIWYDKSNNEELELVKQEMHQAVKAEQKSVIPEVLSEKQLYARTVQLLKKIMSRISGIPVKRIESDVSMEEYGIDSVMITSFSEELEKEVLKVPVTTFFQYQSLSALAEYMVKTYQDILKSTFTENIVEAESKQEPLVQTEFAEVNPKEENVLEEQDTDIAVIGISGRYPGANNVNEFWENLKNAKDCVSEIPKERWNIEEYYDKEKGKKGKIYGRWGGFLKDIDQFDPMFFHISPDDAETMDPQERLFLESVYETLEDAGYTRQSLQKYEDLGLGGSVGVFVGVTFMEYQLYGVESQQRGKMISVPGIPSAIANRVSYCCNFHGPSMSVDTMCSSSLTALNLACESIRQGGCSQAVVGGVNLSLHPNKYLFLSNNYFLSTKGRCEAFGNGGDGYVPGEGIVSILIKPLKQAVKDGDHIYGVIKATAVNHGGKTNGYTVPNPVAQTNVIRKAITKSGINPRAISYIEAHGTGTALGDPIEIAGLEAVFRDYTKECGFCSIGSVKSNIGHLEAASGLAGLTKILLQMKYKELVPSIHSDVLNEHIRFDTTPFHVQHKNEEWKRPLIEVDGQIKEFPRIAALSSFGAGGANAHVIVEEYIEKNRDGSQPVIAQESKAIVVLSAKTKEKLKEQAQRLVYAMDTYLTEADLPDIIYTLQVGRERMEKRISFLIASYQELKQKLCAYIDNDQSSFLYQGEGRGIPKEYIEQKESGVLKEIINTKIEERDVDYLAKVWAEGIEIPWEDIYDEKVRPKRISLPTYPFEQEHYWVPEFEETEELEKRRNVLHALVHENISDLEGQKYISRFSNQNPYCRDYLYQNQLILPEGAYVDMAMTAVQKALPDSKEHRIKLNSIEWNQLITLDENEQEVTIDVYKEANYRIGFEMRMGNETSEAICCQGSAFIEEAREQDVVPIGKWVKEIKAEGIDKEALGRILKSTGRKAGNQFQGLEIFYPGEERCVAKAVLSVMRNNGARDISTTILMDMVMQMLIADSFKKTKQIYQPVKVTNITMQENDCEEFYIEARLIGKEDNSKRQYSVRICNSYGEVLTSIEEVILKSSEVQRNDGQLMLMHPVLQPVKENGINGLWSDGQSERILVLCGLPNQYKEQYIGKKIYMFDVDNKELASSYEFLAVSLMKIVKETLEDKNIKKAFIQLVIVDTQISKIMGGLSGILKTVAKETKKLTYQVIVLEDTINLGEKLKEITSGKWNGLGGELIYQGDRLYRRSVRRLLEISSSKNVQIPWKENGAYWITGGAGGVGLLFAREIMTQVKNAKVFLSGRSPLTEQKQQEIKMLQRNGGTVTYVQADLRDLSRLKQVVKQIQDSYGKLNGILHAAGVIKDSYMIKKNIEEANMVFGPKIAGLMNLDESTKECDIDFMVLFSSAVAEFGNEGQADYSAANAFMDRFAVYRNEQVKRGERKGKTLSINWSLWANGGMQVNEAILDQMYKKKGMRGLEIEDGAKAMYCALEEEESQVIVVAGDLDKIEHTIALENGELKKEKEVSGRESETMFSEEELLSKVAEKLKQLMCATLKLKENLIDENETFDTYGIDSIKMTVLSQALGEHYEELSATVFFEHNSLGAIAEMLVDEYEQESRKWIGVSESGSIKQEIKNTQTVFTSKRGQINAGNDDIEPIAIIGASARFPQSSNLEEYWKNLKEGKSLITEIPEERWSIQGFYSEDKEKAVSEGKSFCKWGGFLENCTEFDPLFFNMSPAEAKRLDPQERIFMEECWKAIEDAGYIPKEMDKELAKHTAVFGGITKTGFNLWGENEGEHYQTSFSSMVNRVSYFMDFNGPSVPVDAMCSSAVVAIHQACECIRHKEAKMALAGAVNLYMHPSNYIELSQAGLIADQKESTVFGMGGSGFVPSEGVGVVVLKRLSDAEKDKDNILAVIRGNGVIHSGRTSGFLVPDPKKQAMVMQETLKRFHIDGKTIRHIEAAANGSEMADAFEMAAIQKVFKDLPDDKRYTMGSVKAMLGHGEAVSGMAQVMKAILELKYRTVCPTILPEQWNPRVNFEKIPYKIATVAERLEAQGTTEEKNPLRIGINSFGAGGVYGHLILEEYRNEQTNENSLKNQNYQIFVFSAKTETSLKGSVADWRTYLEAHRDIDSSLLASILQTRREAMKKRIAIVAENMEELIEALTDYSLNRENERIVTKDNDKNESQAYSTAQRFVNGETVQWDRQYSDNNIRTLSMLPSYSFSHTKFWHSAPDKKNIESPTGEQTEQKGEFVDIMSILDSDIEEKAAMPSLDGEQNAQYEELNFEKKDDKEDIQKQVGQAVREELYDILYLEELDEVDDTLSFMELGLDSITSAKYIQRLNKRLNISINATTLFDYTDMEQLIQFLTKKLVKEERENVQ